MAATMKRPSSSATLAPRKGQFILCRVTHLTSVAPQELKSKGHTGCVTNKQHKNVWSKKMSLSAIIVYVVVVGYRRDVCSAQPS